jgi:uncharacterized protein YdaU (DUF1376 family)
MKGAPYTPWYHGDFLRSIAGWTLIERAVYWMLLCAQWESGPLPHDMTRLASIAGTDATTFATVWPVVSKKFKRTSAGLINERMQEHRKKFANNRARLSAAGKKGMQTRWGKKDDPSKVVEFRGRSKPHG